MCNALRLLKLSGNDHELEVMHSVTIDGTGTETTKEVRISASHFTRDNIEVYLDNNTITIQVDAVCFTELLTDNI